MNDDLRYPIGRFNPPASYTDQDLRQWIGEIGALPGQLRIAVLGLNESQLNTPYRPGGWTLKQVVHHLADSHMNSLMRFKLALTEDNPTIKPYNEPDWALLADYSLPVECSLRMLEGIHQRLVALFESFTENEWAKTFYHPQKAGSQNLKLTLANYAWHGQHHLAHITNTTARF